jgi:FAD synthase
MQQHLYFTFGRFQPPSSMHEELFNNLKSISNNNYTIFVSQTCDRDRNPLSWNEKVNLISSMGYNVSFDKQYRTPANIFENAYVNGYTDVTMLVGEDRLATFESSFVKYKEKWNLNSVNILEFGNRSNCQISSSYIRDSIKNNNYTMYEKLVSPSINNKQDLFNILQERLNAV